MKTKTIALSLGLILVAGGLYAADPWEGTWKLNEMNDRTLSITVKKGGEVLAHGLIIVSADGKSQDVSLTSSAAAMSVYNEEAREKAKDKAFRNKAVYDKE
ncbi:MAG TPA: hypothetical protein VIS53_03355 [Candidatus Udaeobacter sp.]